MFSKQMLSLWSFFFFTNIFCNFALDTNSIVIVILSQADEYHTRIAKHSKLCVETEAKALNKEPPVIYLSHIDFPHTGDWTIIPIISKLKSLNTLNFSWYIFVEDRTEIKLENLLTTLSKYDENEDVWLGYPLHDDEATIIHHFAFYKNPKSFKYPNVASGFAMSTKLLQKLGNRLERDPPKADFNIDMSHEFALYIWNEGNGPALVHEKSFCISNESFCSTIPQPFINCSDPISIESMYFAVKTYSKFHGKRLPVLAKTWALDVKKINFFSDLFDEKIPTIDLGIPNTENGHCGKTIAILKYVAKVAEADSKIRWIILADDDTLFSVPRLQKLLSCYDPTSPIAIGERYGYNVLNPDGYNYITGGGGIVFSRNLVELLSQPGICECPSISSPDDMYLGICISRIDAYIVHSPYFHQARPMDYAKDYLKTQTAISFHKHWMVDPLSVYNNWLLDVPDDIVHTEL